MPSFPCPVCATQRSGYDADCPSCDWRYRPPEAARPPSRRPAKSSLPIFLFPVVVLAVLGLAIMGWRWTRGLGALCSTDSDCTSWKCLRLATGVPQLKGMCTKICTTDADCPDEMDCVGASREDWSVRHMRLKVCSPTGGRLRELIRESL